MWNLTHDSSFKLDILTKQTKDHSYSTVLETRRYTGNRQETRKAASSTDRLALFVRSPPCWNSVHSSTMANVVDTKLYDLLGVSPSATENELKKVTVVGVVSLLQFHVLYELEIVKRVPLLTPVVGEAAGRTCPPPPDVRSESAATTSNVVVFERRFHWGNDCTDNHIIHHRFKADRKRVNNVKTAVLNQMLTCDWPQH